MTIWYPDVSNHNEDMTLEAGTVAVSAKASEGTTYKDKFYSHYKSEAARVGAVFFAYHFLHHGNGAAQAQFCHGIVGNDVTVMIDCEPTTGSNPTVQDCLDFANEYRKLGGKCVLVYFPKWYWKNLGSPSLTPLSALHLGIVSSAYPAAYTDTGEGWSAYAAGQPSPVVWQYTDALKYSGQSVDFNAYLGTVEEFKTLLGYSITPAVPAQALGDDMPYLISVTPDPTGQAKDAGAGIFVVDGGVVTHVDAASFGAYHTKLGDPVVVSDAHYVSLLANAPAHASATVTATVDATALGTALAEALATHIGVAFTTK